jgi:hypothetical protein
MHGSVQKLDRFIKMGSTLSSDANRTINRQGISSPFQKELTEVNFAAFRVARHERDLAPSASKAMQTVRDLIDPSIEQVQDLYNRQLVELHAFLAHFVFDGWTTHLAKWFTELERVNYTAKEWAFPKRVARARKLFAEMERVGCIMIADCARRSLFRREADRIKDNLHSRLMNLYLTVATLRECYYAERIPVPKPHSFGHQSDDNKTTHP